MAAIWDLPFPLVIISLVFIRGFCPLPTTSQYTGMDLTRPLEPDGFLYETTVLPPDSYYGEEDTVTSILPKVVSPVGGTQQRCDYSPCRESQTSCTELAAATGCLCPGLTLYNVAPQAPDLKSVSWNGSEVVLQWCAPNSDVTAYIVTVGGQERQRFGKAQRSGAVGHIDHISEVCIFAMNEAGDSDGSCTMYRPRDNSLPLTAGLIGGALGLLLLILLAVLLWRHKRQRKQEASISAHNAAEAL